MTFFFRITRLVIGTILITVATFALTACGGGGGSSGGGSSAMITYTVAGTATGGANPISGASVNLFLVGTSASSAIASCGTTTSNGGFSCTYTVSSQPSSNPLFYVVISKIQTALGTNTLYAFSQGSTSALTVNELTTAEAADALVLSGGTMSATGDYLMTSYSSLTALTGQIGNLESYTSAYITNISNVPASSLTPSESNIAAGVIKLTTGIQSCIESQSYCASVTPFVTGYSPGNGRLAYGLATAYNNKASGVAGTLYWVNSEMASSNNTNNIHWVLASKTYPAGSQPDALAIDSAGNIWTADSADTNVNELIPSTGATTPYNMKYNHLAALAIDASGNIWSNGENSNYVLKLVPSGDSVNTYSSGGQYPDPLILDSSGDIWVGNTAGTANIAVLDPSTGSPTNNSPYTFSGTPAVLAMDGSGNLWIGDVGNCAVKELSHSGALLNTISFGCSPAFSPGALAIDSSGNVWVADSSSTSTSVIELTASNGYQKNTFTVGTAPDALAIDSTGDIWVANRVDNTVTELSPSGTAIGTYSVGSGNLNPGPIAIDNSGNVWVIDGGSNSVTAFFGAASSGAGAGQYFPYSGPQWP